MRQVLHSAHRAARVDWSVHLSGPPGVGKERLARLIHEESERALGPFLSVNCEEVEPALLEHELFGTGGLIESSAGGTLYLDRIERMDVSVQERLWRHVSMRANVSPGQPRPPRWMTASECSWELAVKEGRFRADLFEKLRGMELRVPALKDRPEDILPLAHAFLVKAAERFQRRVRGVSSAASEKLLVYSWPGNVAELKAAMEYAVLMAATESVEKENLPESIQQAMGKNPLRRAIATLEEVEQQHIQWALEQNGGNREETARQLGIGVATLYRKLKELKPKGQTSI